MINQGNDVPEKTIALFRFEEFTNLNMEDIIKKPNKKETGHLGLYITVFHLWLQMNTGLTLY